MLKIFDATSLIAFLSEMNCPEALVKLSKHYKIVIPQGVANEVRKPPGKKRLQILLDQHVVDVVSVDHSKVTSIEKQHPQLHRGECEAIAFYMSVARIDSCIVSDDLNVIKFRPPLNFKRTQKLLKVMEEEKIIDEKTHRLKIAKLKNSSFYYYEDNERQ